MAGANYMGGRRNAAKARSKDKTERMQKDFFGRRRLNILSKGLAAGPRSQGITPGCSVSAAGRASIDLVHARKATSVRKNSLKTSSTLEATDPASSATKKRKRERSSKLSSSSPRSKWSVQTTSFSTRSTRSKLLQQLDLIEPISSNAAISCILAMSDLAGLCPSRKRMRLESPRPSSISSYDELMLSEEDEIMDYESEPESHHETSDFQSIINSESYSQYQPFQHLDSRIASDLLEQPHIPKSELPQDGTFYNMSPPIASKGSQGLASPGSLNWSILNVLSSPVPDSGSGPESGLSSPVTISISVSQKRPNDPYLKSDEERMVCGDRSLQSSSAKPQQMRHSAVRTVEGTYTNLLDYPDPWEQIGVILGLEEDYRSLSKRAQTPREAAWSQEILASLESDLPPSDVPCDSYDDTLYTQSSLPLAESSESTRVLSKLADVPYSAYSEELGFDDFGFGDYPLDNIFLECLPHDILPFSDAAVALEEKSITTLSPILRTGQQTPMTGVALTGHRDTLAIEETEQLQLPMETVESHLTPASSVGGYDEDDPGEQRMSSSAHLSDGGQGKMGQSPYNVSWNVDVHPQRQTRDKVPCDVLKRDDCSTDIAGQDMLGVPELIECHGVYQGPCLLSEESECSELED